MEEKKKKVVVAFSGGLDTSFTVMYLAKEKGYEVYAACANTGGFSEEQLKTNEENAYKLGAVKYVTLDVTQEYYEKSLKYMVFGNVLRNGTYPISVSSERIFQALAIARYANEIGADAIAHGSTGAGNDQIRFDMTFLVLAPNVEIITLTRDMALSREYEIDYLKEHGFERGLYKIEILLQCRFVGYFYLRRRDPGLCARTPGNSLPQTRRKGRQRTTPPDFRKRGTESCQRRGLMTYQSHPESGRNWCCLRNRP